ncbi:hypothetical protein XELAEV_18016818mg [Xenopus laevis]|uniref:Uncharacterized protein n=1 Tax=Xenopus laevis TaxID=8355 RepID=A0A974DAG3_XENLA|nr:hypothetical protein XELAEV_18016818mg [Xenopus laevis]
MGEVYGAFTSCLLLIVSRDCRPRHLFFTNDLSELQLLASSKKLQPVRGSWDLQFWTESQQVGATEFIVVTGDTRIT